MFPNDLGKDDSALSFRFLHGEDAYVYKVEWYSFYIFPNIEVERYAEYVHIKKITFLMMLMDPTSVHIVARPRVES
jgi:hypothetical protein